ncbi:unnamed protein product, partial [Symbiodinium sp. CCMP2456]
MQFTTSHVLGTVPYRWESQARTYTHAQLLEVEFDSLNVVVLDGPLLHDGGVCAEEKAAAVKVHLEMCSDQKGLLMHELGKQGKAALVRETEEEWELLVPHNLLSQLSFSERVIARWRRHRTLPVSSHWQDAEQAGTDLWKLWDDTVETPCIPDLDLSWQESGSVGTNELMEISGACQKVQPGTKQTVGNMVIQRIVHKEHCAVWSAQVGTDPVMFVASQVVLATPEPPEAVLWALYSAEEIGGHASLASDLLFETTISDIIIPISLMLDLFLVFVMQHSILLCEAYDVVIFACMNRATEVGWWLVFSLRGLSLFFDLGYLNALQVQEATGALCDFLYCRIHLVTGVTDRDMVQERFLLRLADRGYAIAIRACSDGQSRALGLWAQSTACFVARYIIQPNPAGVLVTGVSQTDLGGNVPLWFQGLVKK